MPAKIGCDAHKQFSVFVTIDSKGKTSPAIRVENLASYAGLVPRIIASGGRIRHGGTCRNVNHYLKWGFVEAATCALRLKAYRESHVGMLYHRLAPSKGHGRATVAVARHLAEASFWVLRKRQPYKAPAPRLIDAA